MTAMLGCAIVGAGPGGLTAAVCLAQFRRPIVVFDSGNSRARGAHSNPTQGVDMQRTLMKRFAQFDDAQRARDALVAGGLPEGDVELRSLADEAGAEKGNFTVGNGERAHGPHDAYELNFEDVESAGSNLLVVQTRDETQHARIDAMLDGMGAAPVGENERKA